jgi:hypothetical protein
MSVLLWTVTGGSGVETAVANSVYLQCEGKPWDNQDIEYPNIEYNWLLSEDKLFNFSNWAIQFCSS